MAEHILTFAHLEEEDFPNPKDKLPWKANLNEKLKYTCHNRRFIATTKEKFDRYALPVELPEDEWG